MPRSSETTPPQDPTAGPCPGPYGGPTGVTVFYEQSTLCSSVLHVFLASSGEGCWRYRPSFTRLETEECHLLFFFFLTLKPKHRSIGRTLASGTRGSRYLFFRVQEFFPNLRGWNLGSTPSVRIPHAQSNPITKTRLVLPLPSRLLACSQVDVLGAWCGFVKSVAERGLLRAVIPRRARIWDS